MAALIIEPLISSVITVAISISRRGAAYSVKQIGDRSENETKAKLVIDDIVEKLEEDTQAILQALSSLQFSKLESARQYVQLAMDDLGFGNIRVESDRSDKTDLADTKRLKRLMETAKVDDLQRAMDQLKKADEWATEVFNDTRNCAATVRICAFDIRLFCAALMCWQDQKQWLIKWRRLFEFFFQDRELATLVFCKQKFLSKFLARQNGNAARNQMLRLIESLMNVVRRMICDTNLEEITDFFRFLEENTTNAKYSQKREIRWPFVWHLAYHDDQAMRALIPARYVLYRNGVYLFASGEKTIVISEALEFLNFAKPGLIWATDANGRIVAIDASAPDNRRYISKDKSWDMMACAEQINRVYAKSLPATDYVSVFDATSGTVVEKEKIVLPTAHRDFAFVASKNGILFGYDVRKRERYVLLPPPVSESLRSDYERGWTTTKTESPESTEPAELRSSFLNSKLLILKTLNSSTECVLRISTDVWHSRLLFLETVTWTDNGLFSANLTTHNLKSTQVELFTQTEVRQLQLDTRRLYAYDTVWSDNKDFVVLKLIFNINERGQLRIINKTSLDRAAMDFPDGLSYRNFTADEKRVLLPARYYDRPLALSMVKYYA